MSAASKDGFPSGDLGRASHRLTSDWSERNRFGSSFRHRPGDCFNPLEKHMGSSRYCDATPVSGFGITQHRINRAGRNGVKHGGRN